MKWAKLKRPFYRLTTLMFCAFLWWSPYPSLLKYIGSIVTIVGGAGGYWHKWVAENKKDPATQVPLHADLLAVKIVVVGAFISMASVHSDDLITSTKEKTARQLRQDVILNVSLACHEWKNGYIALYPSHFGQVSGKYRDAWDMLENADALTYSPDSWRHYLPLFVDYTNDLSLKLDRLSSEYADILPVSLRSKILSTKMQLPVEQHTYVNLPQIITLEYKGNRPNANVLFAMRFKEIVRAIAEVDRETERLK